MKEKKFTFKFFIFIFSYFNPKSRKMILEVMSKNTRRRKKKEKGRGNDKGRGGSMKKGFLFFILKIILIVENFFFVKGKL